MFDYGILFLHHDSRSITQYNYKLQLEHNPEAYVIPLTGSPTGEGLPGCQAFININTFNRRWQKVTDNGDATKAWASPDLAICQWMEQNKVRCKRWVITEWDTQARMSWKEFWGDNWDKPAVCISKVMPTPDWPWTPQIETFPKKFRKYACGMYLFGALLFSDEALRRITDVMREEYFEGFSELRIGTISNYVGFDPVSHNKYLGKVHHNVDEVADCTHSDKGIWHPVKHLPTLMPDGTILKGLKIKVHKV